MDEFIFESFLDLVRALRDDAGVWFADHGFKIILILLFAWLCKQYGSGLLIKIFHRTIRPDLYPTKSDRVKRLATIDSITNTVLKIAVFIIAFIMIISELGVDTTPILASAGVLGIALGFGAQSLIKDFTSGIFIIIDNQYRVGDVVQLGEIAGQVEAITIRTTVLRGLDGTLYHVPNGSIETTANMTMSYGGIDEDILFDQNADVGKLTLLINRVGESIAKDPTFERKVKEPPHFLRVVGIDTNGITIKVTGKTTPSSSWDVRGEFYRKLLVELKKAKISLPSAHVSINKNEKSK